MKRNYFKHFVFVAMLLLIAPSAYAGISANAMGDGMCGFVGILTGKWLMGFSILAMIGGALAVLFGGELTDGLKKIATIIAVIGLVLASSSILTMIFTSFSSAGTCG